MAFDGVFAHFMISQIKNNLINKRISKVIAINEADYAFCLSNKQSLLLSADKNFPHFRLSNNEYNHTDNHFGTILKKYFASSFIKDIAQVGCDRIFYITISKADELGYQKDYKLYFEFTGKTANYIITDESDTILEAYHKHFEMDTRIISPNVKYSPLESNRINPFDNLDNTNLFENIYEGVSKLLYSEICFVGDIKKVLLQEIKPTLYKGKKPLFYCFDLKHLNCEREYLGDLSTLIESYLQLTNAKVNENADERIARFFCLKEIEKANNKLAKQQNELKLAQNYKQLEKEAQLLASNIHLVKPYQDEIIVKDFDTNEEIRLALNTKLSPNENINFYFNRVKKQKRTIEALSEQITNTQNEILYYEALLNQIAIATTTSIKEINKEIGLVKPDKRVQKPSITKYIDNDGYFIYVGKNNTQNNYLTNKLARPTDYFFHVASYPGCHVIYNGPLDDEKIKLVASICVYHSKISSIVAVDYVQVKYVKKVKGTPGSFVTYTNQKTTHVDGDINYINQYAKLVN